MYTEDKFGLEKHLGCVEFEIGTFLKLPIKKTTMNKIKNVTRRTSSLYLCSDRKNRFFLIFFFLKSHYFHPGNHMKMYYFY